jgi:GNAT superfamily N-acetyltransferase
VTVRILLPEDQAKWWGLRSALWPDSPAVEIREDPALYGGDEEVVFVWEKPDGALGGFAEGSIRRYADGCSTSPVGFLEAWYVVPGLRRRGVGRQLVEAVEDWVRSKGCTEMGSDTELGNALSRSIHTSVGYREVEKAVHFAKSLGVASSGAQAGPGPDAEISLRIITDANVRAVVGLHVGRHQKAFVASNAVSLAEAYATAKVWPRAIYADETAVGFTMLSDDDEQPRYYLWRFMIDQHYQRCGFGRRAMALVEEYIRSRPSGDRVFLSYVPGPGGPGAFYRSLGYEDTGREHHGEREMVKLLHPATSMSG